MPQTHNKSLSMNFLAAYNFTEQSLRRVKVKNGLDKRICNIKLKYFEKENRFNGLKSERMKARLVENLQKRMAYKFVLRRHPIANATDYPKPLDRKYSYQAFYGEVKEMVHYMKPELARERQAKALVDVNRNRYDRLLRENRAALDVLCPPPPRWQPVDFSKFGKKGEDEDENKDEKTPSPELPAIEQRNKGALARLRRRIITIDDSKPNSPIKSPTKVPALSKPPSSNSLMGVGKRQGITMSMMKKQKSFMSNKEKTETVDNIHTFKAKSTEPPADPVSEFNTSRSVKTTGRRKSVDVNNNDFTNGKINDSTQGQKSGRLTPQSNRTSESMNKQIVLPPIKQNKKQTPGIQAQDIMNSPTLGTSSPAVKLPVLKMNNTRKEIRVH